MRPTRSVPLAVLGVLAVLIACATSDPVTTTSSTSSSSSTYAGASDGSTASSTEVWADGVIDERDGVVPDGVTVFDDQYPGIAQVDADLLQAMRAAADAAEDDGVTFFVHSAWRSPEYQEQLVRDAVAEHGEDDADRWAASPDRSLHVSGDAIDVGGDDARDWLEDHGAVHGICRVYENEPWHFELRPDAPDEGCPALYADASQDPRLQP